MMTIKPYTIPNYMGYGEITVPAGTPVTHQTACGVDENYHFVNDYEWIKENYPNVARILKHDVYYHGINIPKEYVVKHYLHKKTPMSTSIYRVYYIEYPQRIVHRLESWNWDFENWNGWISDRQKIRNLITKGIKVKPISESTVTRLINHENALII